MQFPEHMFRESNNGIDSQSTSMDHRCVRLNRFTQPVAAALADAMGRPDLGAHTDEQLCTEIDRRCADQLHAETCIGLILAELHARGFSDRWIADLTGLKKSTVSNWRRRVAP